MAMRQKDSAGSSQSIGQILKKYGICPDKKLGQHFLVDKNIIRKEVELAGIGRDETVLEIGPGLGPLTRELLANAKNVVAIEKDRRLAEILNSGIPDARLSVVVADALKIDFPAFDRCVSNIPYEISSQIIIKLGKFGKPAILVLQKEFAERLVTGPGDKNYSRISVLAHYYFRAELCGTVSKNSFFPAPKVDSAIVRLLPRSSTEKKAFGIDDEGYFFAVLRALFQHKNKNAGHALIHSRREFGLDKEAAKAVSLGIPFRDRKVDSLTIEELAQISMFVRKAMHVVKKTDDII